MVHGLRDIVGVGRKRIPDQVPWGAERLECLCTQRVRSPFRGRRAATAVEGGLAGAQISENPTFRPPSRRFGGGRRRARRRYAGVSRLSRAPPVPAVSVNHQGLGCQLRPTVSRVRGSRSSAKTMLPAYGSAQKATTLPSRASAIATFAASSVRPNVWFKPSRAFSYATAAAISADCAVIRSRCC